MNATYTKRFLGKSVLREYSDGFSRVALHTQHGEGYLLTDMSIFVDEERRGVGVARRMLQRLLFECDKEGFHPAYVYIDTDCSDGFWDHVGFVVNPLYENQDVPEYGYEKRVGWEVLRTFAQLK